MTKEEFIFKSETRLATLENDIKFKNYSKQLLADKLKADFNKTYKLDYLWRKSLIAISSSCFILEDNVNSKIALKSLYKVANNLENISEIEESSSQFDVDFLRILSALCYDISGYQANAYCIAKKIEEYQLSSDLDINLTEDNCIIQIIQNALLKKIPLIRQLILIKKQDSSNSEPFSTLLFAFELWTNQILNLKENDFFPIFNDAYKLYLNAGNVYISQLILLFKIRIKMYENRSIYLKLKDFSDENAIWNKYIKLLANDYYESYNKIKEVNDKKSIFEFWISQSRAIDDGLLSKDESFVVQMPTSAGKTFIAELFILKYLINYKKKVVYISPFRALVSEKVSELGKYFSYLGYNVSSSTGSYEYEPMFDTVFDDTDVFILTPEKADFVLRMFPDVFNNIGAVVVDEGHIVGDLNSRAALTELLLIKLKNKFPEIKTLFISAVMPPLNASEYALWLSNNKENVLRSKLFNDSSVQEEWEPTRKNIGYFEWTTGQDGKKNGQIQFSNVKTDDEVIGTEQNAFVPYFLTGNEYGIYSVNKKPETAAVLGIKFSETGNTLIFCGKVIGINYVLKKYLQIFQNTPNGIANLIPDENKESYFYSKEWYGENNPITIGILYGVGAHYGDMPEQVRSAVEKDYKNQKLKILLCTNTVGQGVNFPIKNIIFYDISTGFSQRFGQELITHRDFWNIIGRSGRAEKETEGNVIFVVNSPADMKHYNNFINKNNIEKSQSLLSYALKLSLSEAALDSLVLDILETFLLDMITEEVFENDEEFIKNIIKNGLFKIQSNEDDISKIHASFYKAISSLKEKDENLGELKEFGKNGLDFHDNDIIKNFINENNEIIKDIIENADFERFIGIFLVMISENKLNALNDDKLNKIIIDDTSWQRYQNIIFAWLNNKSIGNLRNIWNQEIVTEFKNFYILLAKGLFYLFPWVCNAFIILIAYLFEKEYFDIPEKIRSIPTFLKYGLNNRISCIARECGIKNRETALYLANESHKTTDKEFITWLSNLTKIEIDNMPLSPFEKENILDVSFNLTPKNNTNEQRNFTVSIVGTKYDEQWKKHSKYIAIGDKLTLIRDKDNKYDPFAILVEKNDCVLGFIPRENAKYMATEMDLNNTKYEAIVLSTIYVKEEEYNIINVSVGLAFF